MKRYLLLALLLLTMLLLAGCGTSTQTPAPATQAPSMPGNGTYPTPLSPTTYPIQMDQSSEPAPEGDIPYPWLGDGSILQWPQVVALIQNGQVSRIIQTHDLQLSVTLKDGRTLKASEPAIDDVFRVIEACGAPCADIAVATE